MRSLGQILHPVRFIPPLDEVGERHPGVEARELGSHMVSAKGPKGQRARWPKGQVIEGPVGLKSKWPEGRMPGSHRVLRPEGLSY